MAASILLIWIPIVFSLLFALGAMFIQRSDFLVRRNLVLYFGLCALIFPMSFFAGSFFGLLVSLQINRIFFDFSLLSEVLPEAVAIWFGDGPYPTRQLRPYWATVKAIVWSLIPAAIILSLVLRNRKLRKMGR